MDVQSGEAKCVIQANPDVSGTGIRTSIYALALVSRIVEFLAHQTTDLEEFKDFRKQVNSALNLQGLALLGTSIVQTSMDKLTLFHGICIIHLLALLNLNLPSRIWYNNEGQLRLYVWIATQGIVGCAFCAFAMYIWVTAKTFGSQPECNSSTVYVVFGVSIPATSTAFRWVVIGVVLASAAKSIMGLVFTIGSHSFFRWLSRRYPNGWETYRYDDRPAPKKTETVFQQRMKLVSTLVWNVYAIISLEQTISRNSLEQAEHEWTFGQILSMFMLIGVAGECLELGLAHMEKKRREESLLPAPRPLAVNQGLTVDSSGTAAEQAIRLRTLRT